MVLMLFLQTDHSSIQRDNLPSPPLVTLLWEVQLVPFSSSTVPISSCDRQECRAKQQRFQSA